MKKPVYRIISSLLIVLMLMPVNVFADNGTFIATYVNGMDGNIISTENSESITGNINGIAPPEIEGHIFTGWTANKDISFVKVSGSASYKTISAGEIITSILKVGDESGEYLESYQISEDTIFTANYEEEPIDGKVWGYFYINEFDGTSAVTKPLQNTEITIDGEGVTLNEEGYFFVNKSIDTEGEVILPNGSNYNGITISFNELKSAQDRKIYILSTFTPDRSMFTLSKEWIKPPQESEQVTATAKEGFLISTSPNGPFTESCEININNDGTQDSIYLKSDSGHISTAFTNPVGIDEAAPNITSVETASNNAEVKSHGIYGKKIADLILTVTVSDNGSGLKDIRMIDADNNTYEAVEKTHSGSGMNATFRITNSGGTLNKTLYIEAEDNVGNISSKKLIRYTENESTLTLEENTPEIIGLDIEGTLSNGWYVDLPKVTLRGKDIDSGLARMEIKVNDTLITNKEYDSKVVSEQAIEGSFTQALIDGSENGEFTIVATVTDNSGNTSTREQQVKVDNVVPEITLSGIDNNSSLSEPKNLNIDITENFGIVEGKEVSVVVIKDGSEIFNKDYTDKLSTTINKDTFNEDGVYTVIVNAKDAAGNEAEEKSIAFTVDMTAPILVDKGFDKEPNKDGWYKEEVTFNYEVSDNIVGIKEIKAEINGNTVETKEGKVVITTSNIEEFINNDGTYTIKIIAIDVVGNTSSLERTIKIDIVKPILTLSGITEGAYYQESGDLEISLDEKHLEGSKIHVTVSRNGNVEKELDFDSTANITVNEFNKDGKYNVEVSAIDPAGNKADNEKVSFTVDHTEPIIVDKGTDKEVNENGWYNSPITFTFEATDETSGLESVDGILNGEAVDVSDGHVNITKELIEKLINKNGTYRVEIKAEDRSGNTKIFAKTFKIDLVSPNLSFEGIIDKEFYKEAPKLEIISDEKHALEEGHTITVTITRNGEHQESKTFSGVNKGDISSFKNDGKYTVTALAKDAAGNESEKIYVSFTKDSTAPVIKDSGVSGGSLNSNGWYNKPIQVNLDISDETAGVQSVKASVNGESVPISDGKILITKKVIEDVVNSSGTYKVEVIVKDKSGNEKTFTNTYKIDLVSPEVSISGAAEGDFFQGAPSVTITSNEKHYQEEGAFIYAEIYRNGTKVSEKTFEKTNSGKLTDFREDGLYKIISYSVDAAGNKGAVQNVSFTKDSTKPVIKDSGVSEGSPNSNGWYSKPITSNFEISDETAGVKSITATVNGKHVPIENGKVHIKESIIRETANDAGTFTVDVVVRDNSGNSESISRTYKIDLDKPNITLSGINTEIHHQISPTLNIYSDDRYSGFDGHTVTVRILRDNNVVSETPYHGQATLNLTAFNEDGDYQVIVRAVDSAGNTSDEETLSFTKDGTSPVITITGTTEGAFHNTGANPLVTVTERYWNTNTVEVALTRELNGVTVNIPFTFTSTGEISTGSLNLTETGFYTLTVTARDKAGNVADPKTVTFYVDMEAPEVEINGVESKVYGFDDVINPEILYRDDYFDNISYSVTKGGVDITRNLEVREVNGRVSVGDIPKEKSYDGHYVLTVIARDRAGNIRERVVEFTVNRFGSYFVYTDSVSDVNAKWLKDVNKDFTILEYNLSRLTESNVEIKLDGKVLEGTTKSILTGTKDGYNETSHVFDKTNFEKEGVYELNVISRDSAGNSMESKVENGEVKFILDRTSPSIVFTNADNLVNAESHEVGISVSDNMSPEIETSIYLNGEKVNLSQIDGKYTVKLGEGESQEIKVEAKDLAGNTTTDTVMVSVIANKAVYTTKKFSVPLIIGGVGALGLAGFIFLFISRRKKEDEEE